MSHPFSTALTSVAAVETHYYWSNLVTDLREVQRVMKPGDAFITAGFADVTVDMEKGKGWICAVGRRSGR